MLVQPLPCLFEVFFCSEVVNPKLSRIGDDNNLVGAETCTEQSMPSTVGTIPCSPGRPHHGWLVLLRFTGYYVYLPSL